MFSDAITPEMTIAEQARHSFLEKTCLFIPDEDPGLRSLLKRMEIEIASLSKNGRLNPGCIRLVWKPTATYSAHKIVETDLSQIESVTFSGVYTPFITITPRNGILTHEILGQVTELCWANRALNPYDLLKANKTFGIPKPDFSKRDGKQKDLGHLRLFDPERPNTILVTAGLLAYRLNQALTSI